MLLIFRFTCVMACLCFINTTSNGQEFMNPAVPATAHFQLSDQPVNYWPQYSTSNDVSSFSSGNGCSSGAGCYGRCDTGQYSPTSSHAEGCSCGGGNCQSCRNGGRGFLTGELLNDKKNMHREYFEYEPNLPCPGDRLYALMEPQLANGRSAQLAFYGFHFQWSPETKMWHLSRSGWYNVQKLARILPITPGTILVDPTGNPQVDEDRAQLVREAFSQNGLTSIPVNVAVGKPRGGGLYGAEALNIYEQRQLPSPLITTSNSISTGIGPSVSPSSGGGSPR